MLNQSEVSLAVKSYCPQIEKAVNSTAYLKYKIGESDFKKEKRFFFSSSKGEGCPNCIRYILRKGISRDIFGESRHMAHDSCYIL